MKKRDPNKVVDGFRETIQSSIDTWGDVGHQISWHSELAKGLSVDAFLRAAVAWETFRSDWHAAAINKDASAFRDHLVARFQASMQDKWAGLAAHVAIDLPRHPSLVVINDLLDIRGYNVTFGTCDKWVDRCRYELVDPWRGRVISLSSADRRLIDCVAAMRDCIAHRSRGSVVRLDDALKSLSVAPDKPLRKGTNRVRPSGIGTYLFAVAGPGGARRVQLYHARLDSIAESLRS